MTWYYATRETTPTPAAIKIVAFDAGGDRIGTSTSTTQKHGVNQTRSNIIGALIREYGDRFHHYEEWHREAP